MPTPQATEDRRIEAALRESEQRYRELFENTSDGLFLLDVTPEGRFRIVRFNPAEERMVGLRTADVEGRFVDEAFPGALGAALSANYRRCVEAGVPTDFEETLDLPTGRGTFLTTLIPVRDADGRFHRIVGVARDVTERRRLEREREDLQAHLAQAQKLEAVGTLAGGIAHDFNNILGAILGYADMAIEELPADAGALRTYLERLVRAAERASSLTRQILAFGRQTAGERHLLQLRPLVKEVLKLLRAALPSTVEVRQELRTEGLVLGDPSELHQVLMNLGTNAGLAMPDGGVLTVGLDEVGLDAAVAEPLGLGPGRYVRLIVADTGCGIPPEALGRIFEPFFTTRPEGKGTGLGLSVVHGIVTGSGGAVTVASEPGRGATFEVLLPKAEGAPADAEALRPESLAGRERILFVDDEEMLVEIARLRLGALGYRVEGFTRSLDALEAFRADPESFDAVVSDVTMPGLTGDALAVEVRRLRPEIPVILATGYSERLTSERVEALGVDAVFDKPVPPVELTRVLRELLDGR